MLWKVATAGLRYMLMQSGLSVDGAHSKKIVLFPAWYIDTLACKIHSVYQCIPVHVCDRVLQGGGCVLNKALQGLGGQVQTARSRANDCAGKVYYIT